jgi:hypothetical protein
LLILTWKEPDLHVVFATDVWCKFRKRLIRETPKTTFAKLPFSKRFRKALGWGPKRPKTFMYAASDQDQAVGESMLARFRNFGGGSPGQSEEAHTYEERWELESYELRGKLPEPPDQGERNDK